MNARTAKRLRQLSYEFAAEWLKSLLPEEQHHKCTPQYVKRFEETQDKYIYTADGERICSAYSSRSFYKKIKAAYKKGVRPNFLVMEKELGIG